MRPDARDRYFEQRDIWMKDLLPYQKHVLADILEVIPADTASILDVGCGDGVITNALPASVDVVGLDKSQEALKHVKRSTVLGDATSLPFGDASFDLVMANDLIEHLPKDDQARALSEMARVSRKYVVVTVPFLEDLNLGAVKCAACERYYHLNHHLHSFGLSNIAGLLEPYGYTRIVQILTGDAWDKDPDEVVFLKRLLCLDIPQSPSAVCPHCGGTTTASPRVISKVSPILDRIALDRRMRDRRSAATRAARTECITLFSRNGNDEATRLSGTPIESLESIRLAGNRIDFANSRLFRREFLPRYSRLPYFCCMDSSDAGAVLSSGNRLLAGFFCNPAQGAELSLRIAGKTGQSSVTVCPYDSEIGYHFPQSFEVSGEFSSLLPVPKAGLSTHGLLFEVTVSGDPVIFSSAEISGATSEDVQVLKVPAGVRFARLPSRAPLLLSMPFYSGWCVAEEWMHNPSVLSPADVPVLGRSGYSGVGKSLLEVLDFLQAGLDKMADELGSSQTQCKTLADDLESSRVQCRASADELESSRDQCRALATDLESSRDQCRALATDLESSREQCRALATDLESSREQCRALAADLEASREHCRALTADLESSRAQCKVLADDLESLKSECSDLRQRLARTPSRRLKRWFLSLGRGQYETFLSFRNRVLLCAEPKTVDANWDACSVKKFLMICHDQKIDRRIIQQASALVERGWHGKIIALSFDGEDRLDECGGIQVHRVGLNRIVPECPVYWRYQNRQRWINWWGRAVSLLSRLNWGLYKAELALTYRCRSVYYPLPFDNCFYAAGKHYRPDVIVAHDLTSLAAGHRLKEEWRVPLVYDAHELYYEQRVFSGVQKRMARATEERLIHLCDLAMTVNLSISSEMSSRYGCKPPEVLLNVIDAPARFDPVRAEPLLRKHFGFPAGTVVILYQGGIVPGRSLEMMVRSMRHVRSRQAVLVLMGSGPLLERLKAVVRRGSLEDKVFFKEEVPQSDLLYWTASGDVGIIPYPHIDLNSYYCTPNKLFEYIQAGVPIIGNDSPELRRFISDTGFGVVGPMSTARQIAALIDMAVAQQATIREARQRILERRGEFSWSSAAPRYVRMIEELISQERRWETGQ